jgi:hypothetical protein
MRLKVALAAAAAAVLLALAPYTVQFLDWRYDPANYPKLVKWAGCTAEVIVTDGSPAGSFYSPTDHALVIGGGEDPNVPYYAGLIILLHETGHCLQFQADPAEQMNKYRENPVMYELDADRRAADLACGLGLDGRQLLIDTFEWARVTFGYHGDPYHGTLEQRESQAMNAHACDKVVGQ